MGRLESGNYGLVSIVIHAIPYRLDGFTMRSLVPVRQCRVIRGTIATISLWVTGLYHLPSWSQDRPQSQAPYPKLTLVLTDKANSDSDFGLFRDRLRQAIRKRDAAFVKQSMDPNIQLTFGRPFPIAQLNLENPKALVWQNLERVMQPGCATLPSRQNNAPTTWVCPTVFAAHGVVKHIDAYKQIFIVGADIVVRRQPSPQGAAIDTLSHQVVKFDPSGMEKLSAAQRKQFGTNSGWIPILLPDGRHGFVSGRYAYSPLAYRAIFQKNNGQWKMQAFLGGD